MRRLALLALAVMALAACGSSGQSLATRCRAAAYASAVHWANGFTASLPGPISASRRAGLIAPLAAIGTRNCLAHPARFLHQP